MRRTRKCLEVTVFPRRCAQRVLHAVLGVALVGVLTSCVATPDPGSAGSAPANGTGAPLPRPRHVVVVVLENHGFTQVSDAPFLSKLERSSAVLTNAHAVSHPSEPNHLALWSGSTQGLVSDACPVGFSGPSLGSQLIAAQRSVVGYFESMPSPGFLGCSAGGYVRKHNPLAAFRATADAAHLQPFTAFPTDFSRLPDVALVVPNLQNDMHDGSVAAGDAWLARNIGPYASWAQRNDSILVVTWDENDNAPGKRILTLVAGQRVQPGAYAQRVDHVAVLHTLEAMFGLAQLGPAALPVTGIWR